MAGRKVMGEDCMKVIGGVVRDSRGGLLVVLWPIMEAAPTQWLRQGHC